YRPERLAETERNLRALHFLKSASVVASEPHDGLVDVTVTTQDAWSIAPETQAGSKGGTSTLGFDVSDSNFLGYGKQLEVGWDRNVDRSGTSIDYDDPAFFASYWNARFTYRQSSDGYNHRVNIRRPFFSFATQWSADFSFNAMRQHDKIYGGGVTIDRFREDHQRYALSFGRALTDSDSYADRIVTGIRYQRDEFDVLPESTGVIGIPPPRDYRYLFARYEHAENEFMKLNFVNKDMRYEDYNLGRQYSLEAAVSPRDLGAERTSGFGRVTLSEGFRIGANGFVMPALGVESRLDRGLKNAIASANVNVIQRFEGDHPSALVGRVALTNGWNTDREVQFFADGLTGLRGYRAHAFAGTKAVVMNVEQRFYLGRELLQLISPGVVVFADAGNATNDSFGKLFRLKTDVGVGIRIGLPRTPKNLLRLDFAYALNRDSRGKHGLLVSVSSGQAF
ncbi:MAG: hypothetical protein JWO56_1189, partial [Acidobacteria bacterium]|nr:hypothetical protein [Acidobacteriota bacterium]